VNTRQRWQAKLSTCVDALKPVRLPSSAVSTEKPVSESKSPLVSAPSAAGRLLSGSGWLCRAPAGGNAAAASSAGGTAPSARTAEMPARRPPRRSQAGGAAAASLPLPAQGNHVVGCQVAAPVLRARHCQVSWVVPSDARLMIAGTDPVILGRRSPVRKGRDGLLMFVASTLVPHGAAALSPAQRHCCAISRRTKLSSFGSNSTTCHARVRME